MKITMNDLALLRQYKVCGWWRNTNHRGKLLYNMPQLRLIRNSEYNNRFRKFNVFNNGKKIGEITNGEEKLFDLPEGQNTVVAKIDWCSSPEMTLTVQKNELKTLYVSRFKGGKLLSWIGMAIMAIHFVLSYAFDFHYFVILMAPLVLYLFYLFTFGRKKYLHLTDIFEP